MSAVDLSFSDAALDLLDTYLLSDQSPPESMPLSVLDGFLTGIAIGPELVMPSEWLPYVWGGEDPVFDDQAQASAILGAIMGRYNAILREIEAGTFEPLVWEAPDGTMIADDWAEGFMHAVVTGLADASRNELGRLGHHSVFRVQVRTHRRGSRVPHPPSPRWLYRCHR
jgi:yecA family protein